MARDILFWDFKNNDILANINTRLFHSEAYQELHQCVALMLLLTLFWVIHKDALFKNLFFFIPQHFSWQEVDNEKVQNEARALTLEITRRLNEISVCLVHPLRPPSSAQHCKQRIMPHSLDLFMLTVFHRSTFFLKRGNWYFYISYGWDTFSLSIIVWKCFLETQMMR